MKIKPEDFEKLTEEETKKLQSAMILKKKVDNFATKLIQLKNNIILDFAVHEPGIVRTEFSEQLKDVGTITIKGSLEFDVETKIPMRMTVEESLLGSGISRSVSTTNSFIFENRNTEKIYGMRGFGLRQDLVIEKSSGTINFNEAGIML